MALEPTPIFLAALGMALGAAGAWGRRQDRRRASGADPRAPRPEPEPAHRLWVLVATCLLGAAWTGGYPLVAAAALVGASLALACAGAWSLTRGPNLPRAAGCFAIGTLCALVAGVALSS